MILPSLRTLQKYKRDHVPNGSGAQRDLFLKARELFASKAQCDDDWKCIVTWDATGYAKRIYYDKNTRM